jgi:hypothetical protein
MRRAIILVGLGLALAGGFCWLQHRPAHPAPVNAPLYETDMIESLVRNILAEMKPPLPPVCFLAFGDGGTPPSRAFIARFRGTSPVMLSYQTAAAPPTGQFFETSTGRPGLVVHVIRFEQTAPGTFDVLVRFSNRPPGHDHLLYRVAQVDDAWVVQSSHSA